MVQLTPIVDSRGFDLGLDVNPLAQQLSGLLQRNQQKQETLRLEEIENKRQILRNFGLQASRIRGMQDGVKSEDRLTVMQNQKRDFFQLIQEAQSRGEDVSELLGKVSAAQTPDDLNTVLSQIVTRAAATDEQVGDALLKQGVLRQEEAKKTSLQQNLIASGFTPGTPEFESKMLELISKPTGTTVNVGTGGFKVPTGFMINPDDPTEQSVIPIPGGKGGTLSGEGAKLEEISRGGLAAVGELTAMLESGNITQETLAAATAPEIFNFFKSANVQEFETLRADLADMIGRLRSGGAINTDEEATFLAFLPVFGDKDSVMKNKFRRLEDKFKNISSKVSLAPIKSEEQPNITKFDAQGNPVQ